MELRVLMIAARVLDPRKWKLRLLQLGGAGTVLGWIWVRAVQRAEVERAVADARHEQRRARIRAANHAREAGKLRP
ncbi:MAG: hypothetical protein JWM98_1559 [Thermoleophilia bacterium]|nr:hypothetical protein [Thermoleophilia bacterium]